MPAERFAASWLRLREAADAKARSALLARRFAGALPVRPRLLDLGAGTGANRRYLDRFLPQGARWTLVDAEPALLAGSAAAERVVLDLASEFDRLDFSRQDGVTASALLDLVSADWLGSLVSRLASERLPVLAALTVDGLPAWDPPHPEDEEIHAAFARDQGRDKGFGPALGADAAGELERLLAAAGYRVATARSDWVLGPGETAMIDAVIDGMAAVARARDWAARRHEQAAQGALRLRVGHRDVLGLPPLAR